MEEMKACANCRALLVGEFCHQCGQRDRNYVRGAFSMLWEAIAETFEWDSRVGRTVFPLFFRPGYLSSEWVRGLRASYVQPVRLYLLVSIVFFIVLAAATDFDANEMVRIDGVAAGSTEAGSRCANLQINLPFLDEDDAARIRERCAVVSENPDLLLDQARALAPQVMFALLPLFALLLKFLYLFARRFYIEHLVLALHTHSFMFVAFTALFALGGIRAWAGEQVAAAWVATPAGWAIAALWVWVPLYLLLAQKRFYRQGWPLTVVKFLLTGALYLVMINLAMAALFVLSFMTA